MKMRLHSDHPIRGMWGGALTLAVLLLAVSTVQAGTYASSSHGQAVDRSSIDSAYSQYIVGNCSHCHEQHGSVNGSEPNPVNNGPSPYLGLTHEEELCFTCHDGSTATTDIKSQFSASYAYSHPKLKTVQNVHKAGENQAADFSGTNRHAECTDCHNPHAATGVNDADKGPMYGATGIDPSNGGAGTEPGHTFVTVSNPDEQYKVCFKCHSGWSTGQSTMAAVAFNVNNESYHYVEGDKPYTQKIYSGAQFNSTWVGKMMPRYAGASNATLQTAKMRCSDCHGPTDAGTVPEGVHGSNMNHILKIPAGSPYTEWDSNSAYPGSSWGSTTSVNNIWCFNCHSSDFTGTGFSDGGYSGNLHLRHDGENCQYCHLANPHGQTGLGTQNQRKHLLNPDFFSDEIDNVTPNNWDRNGHDYRLSGSCGDGSSGGSW